jgi:hypothetical protein
VLLLIFLLLFGFGPLLPLTYFFAAQVYENVPYFEKRWNAEKKQEEWQCLMCKSGVCPADRALDHCKGVRHMKNYKQLVLAYNQIHGTSVPLPVPCSKSKLMPPIREAKKKETPQFDEKWMSEPLIGPLAFEGVPYAEFIRNPDDSGLDKWRCLLCASGFMAANNGCPLKHCEGAKHQKKYSKLVEAHQGNYGTSAKPNLVKTNSRASLIAPESESSVVIARSTFVKSNSRAELMKTASFKKLTYPRAKSMTSASQPMIQNGLRERRESVTGSCVVGLPSPSANAWLPSVLKKQSKSMELTPDSKNGSGNLLKENKPVMIEPIPQTKAEIGRDESIPNIECDSSTDLSSNVGGVVATPLAFVNSQCLIVSNDARCAPRTWLDVAPKDPLQYDDVPYVTKVWNKNLEQFQWQCLLCKTGKLPLILEHCKGDEHCKNHALLVTAWQQRNSDSSTNVFMTVDEDKLVESY